VVILGGGVAGVEALLALGDLAGDRARLTLVAPDPDFVYKPLLVEEPFGLGPPEQRALAPLAEEHGAEFVLDEARAVRPEDHAVDLVRGGELTYDHLVVAVGGRFRSAFSDVITFPSPQPVTADHLIDGASELGEDIAFVVPPGVTWSLPLYELALMTDRRIRERGEKLGIRLLTPEQEPLAVFGPAASAAVRQLLEARRIEVVTATRVHQEDGELVLTPGDDRLQAAVVVSLPTMEGPALPGLPSDELGFIPIDDHARARGADDVYAAGDGTNFPIKQGGLATQQADAAAADIAHRLGAAAAPEPFRPILRGKLLTGDTSLHMRADVAGGGGEGESSLDCLWWPPYKVSGRYLTPWLYHEEEALIDAEPPEGGLEVEIALPTEWHEEPMALDPHRAHTG
jgi:sulfide:quinone oxidoreductase